MEVEGNVVIHKAPTWVGGSLRGEFFLGVRGCPFQWGGLGDLDLVNFEVAKKRSKNHPTSEPLGNRTGLLEPLPEIFPVGFSAASSESWERKKGLEVIEWGFTVDNKICSWLTLMLTNPQVD